MYNKYSIFVLHKQSFKSITLEVIVGLKWLEWVLVFAGVNSKQLKGIWSAMTKIRDSMKTKNFSGLFRPGPPNMSMMGHRTFIITLKKYWTIFLKFKLYLWWKLFVLKWEKKSTTVTFIILWLVYYLIMYIIGFSNGLLVIKIDCLVI